LTDSVRPLVGERVTPLEALARIRRVAPNCHVVVWIPTVVACEAFARLLRSTVAVSVRGLRVPPLTSSPASCVSLTPTVENVVFSNHSFVAFPQVWLIWALGWAFVVVIGVVSQAAFCLFLAPSSVDVASFDLVLRLDLHSPTAWARNVDQVDRGVTWAKPSIVGVAGLVDIVFGAATFGGTFSDGVVLDEIRASLVALATKLIFARWVASCLQTCIRSDTSTEACVPSSL